MNAMRWKNWVLPLALLACLPILAAACQNYDPVQEKTAYQAPLLTGSDDAQAWVDLRGNLNFGEVAVDAFSAQKPLTGYLFDALPGARVTVTLTVTNGEDPVLILYGPMTDKGIWGQYLAMDDDGKDGLNSLLSNISLPGGGRYLLAAATYSGASGGDFTMVLGCAGNCAEPRCEDVLCDLYCPNGFMTDPNGCPICRCAGVECQADSDCPILTWTDQVPVCIDGRCVYEEPGCQADSDCPADSFCVLDVCPGAPCEEGEECPPCLGHCEPRNQCLDGEVCFNEAGLPGQCLNGRCLADAIACLANADCPPAMVCEPSCDFPCDPDDPTCEPCPGVCVPDQAMGCGGDADCPVGTVCVTECWERCDDATGTCYGECHSSCVPDHPVECQSDDECIRPDGTVGLCVNGRCIDEQIFCDDATACPPGMVCQMACWDCDPADPDCAPGCEGVCVPEHQPACFSDFDCVSPDGQIGRCVDGYCLFDPMQCNADFQCPPGFACELQYCLDFCSPDEPDCCFGICVPNQEPQCRSDEECISAAGDVGRCIDGRCVFDGCTCPEIWDPVCAELCFDLPCDPTTDPDCGGGACEVRTFPNACFADCEGAVILFPGECGDPRPDCMTDADCRPGEYCQSACDFPCDPNTDPACDCAGVCMPLPPMECFGDSDCQAGFRCEPGVCPEWPCDPDDPTCEPCGPDGVCPPCPGQCVPAGGDCIVTGCSGEICAPYPVSSTCIWLPEYECLQFSSCQTLFTADGQTTCGWAQNPEYLACLENLNNSNSCDADAECPPGSYCQVECWDDGFCQGRCLESGCVCPEYFDPICGADGVTYDNVCFLNCAGAPPLYFGVCGDETNP